MSSIPADAGLVLGNLVTSEKKEYLRKIANARKPQNLAQKKVHDLTLSSHKLETVYQDMINAGVEGRALKKLEVEVKSLKKQMAKAGIELGNTSITCEAKVREIERKWGHKESVFNFESPIDFAHSKLRKIPLSYDSTNMDINYFRNETAQSGSKSSTLASKIYKYVSSTYSSWSTPAKAQNLGKSAHRVLEQQSTNHEVDGVIVICAHCTHKMAEVYDPMVLNPVKALNAWNATFPDDIIKADRKTIKRLALLTDETDADDNKTKVDKSENETAGKSGEKKGKKNKSKSRNCLHLITGATFGSSFVGFVHIKKTEDTASSQNARSLANSLNQAASESAFSNSDNFAKTAKSLVSNSHIDTHCSLVTEGIIPNLASDSIPTTIARLKPNPGEVMAQLKAISDASDVGVGNPMESAQKRNELSSDFMKMNNSYLETTIKSVGEFNTEENKTFNLNSLMTAFQDYVDQAKGGDCGFFQNFFVRDFFKRDIAKAYYEKYYASSDDSGNDSGNESGNESGNDSGNESDNDSS